MAAEVILRVLEFSDADGARESSDADAVAPPAEGVIRWIDIERPDAAVLDLLGRRFGFHTLALEDCAHFDQRPKIETYEGQLFIVTHGFELLADTLAPHPLELHTFLGPNYLVSVHDAPIPPMGRVWDRLRADAAAGLRGADFIRYLISDAIIDAFFPILDDLATRIEEVEDTLLSRPARRADLRETLALKRLLIALRRVIPAQRDVHSQLAKREHGRISEQTAPYFRDVYDHLLRLTESVELNRELLGHVLDAYQWTVSQRTNEIVKRLTIISAVFLPLTFITGFFGQNFEGLPFGSGALLVLMLVSCAIVPPGMLWLILRSRWFLPDSDPDRP